MCYPATFFDPIARVFDWAEVQHGAAGGRTVVSIAVRSDVRLPFGEVRLLRLLDNHLRHLRHVAASSYCTAIGCTAVCYLQQIRPAHIDNEQAAGYGRPQILPRSVAMQWSSETTPAVHQLPA